MRLPGVRAERRVRVGRNAPRLSRRKRLFGSPAGGNGFPGQLPVAVGPDMAEAAADGVAARLGMAPPSASLLGGAIAGRKQMKHGDRYEQLTTGAVFYSWTSILVFYVFATLILR